MHLIRKKKFSTIILTVSKKKKKMISSLSVSYICIINITQCQKEKGKIINNKLI